MSTSSALGWPTRRSDGRRQTWTGVLHAAGEIRGRCHACPGVVACVQILTASGLKFVCSVKFFFLWLCVYVKGKGVCGSVLYFLRCTFAPRSLSSRLAFGDRYAHGGGEYSCVPNTTYYYYRRYFISSLFVSDSSNTQYYDRACISTHVGSVDSFSIDRIKQAPCETHPPRVPPLDGGARGGIYLYLALTSRSVVPCCGPYRALHEPPRSASACARAAS